LGEVWSANSAVNYSVMRKKVYREEGGRHTGKALGLRTSAAEPGCERGGGGYERGKWAAGGRIRVDWGTKARHMRLKGDKGKNVDRG